MSERVWLDVIEASNAVEFKITHRPGRGCTLEEVAEAFQGRRSPDLPDLWIREDGTVAGFGTTASGRRLFAAFYPDETDEGRWRLMTCYPV